MAKPCPNCGATPAPGVRYCRQCGSPLRPLGGDGREEPVSPLAQTVPLTGEGRPTGGLGGADPTRPSSDTTRVGRAEMEEVLSRARARASDITHEAKGGADALRPAASEGATAAPGQEAVAAPKAPNSSQAPKGRRLWQVAAVVLLLVALVAGGLAFLLSRGSGSADGGGSAPPISLTDQKQLVEEKLAEGRSLLDAGEFNRAAEVLRAAVKLDPTSLEARLRLGDALERIGVRAEAIEEYRAAALANPNAASAWHALARAQFEEKIYADAAESYRRLLSASGNALDDETWLDYAEAMRLAGRPEDARAAYQRVSSSPVAGVAQTARQRLAQMGPVVASNASEGKAPAEQHERVEEAAPSPSPSQSPQAVVANSSQTPAAEKVSAAPPAADYDSYYFQALNVVNGRDPKSMERAELLRALALFQRAALGGSHQSDARRYADRLGKEYDRRRK